MTAVVVVTGLMRSGTTVYRQLLDSSGVAFDIGETFNVDVRAKTNFFRYWHASAVQNPLNGHPYSMHHIWNEFLERMRDASGQPIIVVDAKKDFFPILRVPQLDSDWPILPMLAHGSKMVRIKRRNLFSQIVSLELADRTKTWAIMNPKSRELPRLNGEQNDTWTAPEGGPPPFELDPSTIASRLDELHKANQELDALTLHHPACTTFVYEEMFDGDGQWGRDVIEKSADILGVRPDMLNPTPRLAKQNTYLNRQVVANYDAVARCVRNTRHAWMVGYH